MKLAVKRVYTLVEMVDVPDVCPKCETELASTVSYLGLGWIERAPDAMGIHYFKAGRID